MRNRSLRSGWIAMLGMFFATTPSVMPAHAGIDGQWWSGFGNPNPRHPDLNQQVLCTAEYNGDLIVGGSFTSAGGQAVSYIARWNGSAWSPLGPGLIGTISTLAVYNGELIAGGTFYYSGDYRRVNNIARWNGASWDSLGSGLNAYAWTMTVFRNHLIVGGSFSTAGGSPASAIAEWDGSHWSAVGDGIGGSGRVSAVGVMNDDLYVAGQFSAAGGVPASNIARWDGSDWHEVGGGTSGSIAAMTVHDGGIIVGGPFASAGGMTHPGIARWDGVTWSDLGEGVGYGVSTLTTFGADLVAGGEFGGAGDVPLRHLARWNGIEWNPLGGGIGEDYNHVANALLVYDGDLVVGGNFTSVGNVRTGYLARWNGIEWDSYERPIPIGMGTNAGVYALADVDGDLYAGGSFTLAGDSAAAYVARWDGRAWHPLGTGMSLGFPDPSVSAICAYNDRVVVGGSFRVAGDVSAWNIAAWNDTTWINIGGFFALQGIGSVLALMPFGSDLIAGGTFTQTGGWAMNYISRFDGTGWSEMDGGMNSPVYCLTEYHGDLIAGGHFTMAGGDSAGLIARWTGTSWSPIGPGLSGSSYPAVYTMRVLGDDLIVGGNFTRAGSTALNGLAKWDGATWSPMWSSSDGSPVALTVHGGNLIVAGNFQHVNGLSLRKLACWDGASWSEVGGGIGNTWPQCLCDRADGLYAGGSFTQAGDVESYNIARWMDSIVPIRVTSFDAERIGSSVSLRWSAPIDASGAGFVVYRAEFGYALEPISDVLHSTRDGMFEFLDPDPSPGELEYRLREVESGGAQGDWVAVLIVPAGSSPANHLLLTGASPNPFKEDVAVRYEIPSVASASIRLGIYDVLGREVYTRTDSHVGGLGTIRWSGRDGLGREVPAGVYILQLRWNGQTRADRIVKIR
jgi:trimeric autotransporter adhesin